MFDTKIALIIGLVLLLYFVYTFFFKRKPSKRRRIGVMHEVRLRYKPGKMLHPREPMALVRMMRKVHEQTTVIPEEN